MFPALVISLCAVALLASATSVHAHSLRFTFEWYPGPISPAPDVARYAKMSSGVIQPDEYPSLSDTRFLLSCGPFTLRPASGPDPDTLIYAVTFVSADNLTDLHVRVERALEIYLNGGIPLSIDDSPRNIIQSFQLEQNYPNPFNAATEIRFSVPQSGHVSLRLYDMLGREIETLVDAVVDARYHTARFDASRYASGVYIYRLSAAGAQLSGKAVLLK